MTVEWEKYRGPGLVTFSQIKQPLKDGKAEVSATFSEYRGSYTLQGGCRRRNPANQLGFGYHCCWIRTSKSRST